ncbi:MAG: shikimate kinase [Candidatus Lambdaproteobacteria bacterium]|nr:shikimate kinase [Candidatus Lambdaproteobacteria bacterium]
MNVVLVGFMASGKSSVGKRVARRLGYSFLDTDHFIEAELGCTISEIFAIQGEPYFRMLETRLLQNLPRLENHVIATGGGIVTTPGNMELLKRIGVVVFLNAEREDIISRLERDTRRPMVQGGDLRERVTTLLDKRLPLYREADVIVNTAGCSVNQTASEVLRQVARRLPELPLHATSRGARTRRGTRTDAAAPAESP